MKVLRREAMTDADLVKARAAFRIDEPVVVQPRLGGVQRARVVKAERCVKADTRYNFVSYTVEFNTTHKQRHYMADRLRSLRRAMLLDGDRTGANLLDFREREAAAFEKEQIAKIGARVIATALVWDRNNNVVEEYSLRNKLAIVTSLLPGFEDEAINVVFDDDTERVEIRVFLDECKLVS